MLQTLNLAYTFRDISPDNDEVKAKGLSEEFTKVLPFNLWLMMFSKKTIYTLRKTGIIKCIKMGRDYIFPKTELDCFSINCKEDVVFLSKVNEVLRCEK